MFIIETKRVEGIISVDSDFARIIGRDGNNIDFRLHYKVDAARALKSNVNSVRVTVLRDEVSLKGIILKSSTSRSVDDVLSETSRVRDAVSSRTKSTLTTRSGDITSRVSNEIAHSVPDGFGTRHTTSFKNVLDVKTSDSVVISSVRSTSEQLFFDKSISSISPKGESHSLLLHGKDPSSSLIGSPRVITSKDVSRGFTGTTSIQHTGNSKNLQDSIVTPKSDVQTTSDTLDTSVYVEVIDETTDGTVTVMTDVSITVDLKNPIYTVKFEAIDNTGVLLDSSSKSLNVIDHIRLLETPITPPSLSVRRKGDSHVLTMRQNDLHATKIVLYGKFIPTCESDWDSYRVVGEYTVNPGETKSITSSSPKQSIYVYRAISRSQQGVIGLDYENIVVSPLHMTKFSGLTVSTMNIVDGIKIEVSGIQHDVVSVRVVGVDRTNHGHEYPVGVTVFINTSTDTASVVDAFVERDHIYEYSVAVTYRDGTTRHSGFSSIQRVIPSDLVSTTVKDQTVKTDSVKSTKFVTFTISSTITETSFDTYKRTLTAQGLYDLYSRDIFENKEKLTNLLMYRITRLDLTTGQLSDFGVVSTTDFDESKFLDTRAIDPVKNGHRYRYDIEALFMPPNTLIDTVTVEKTDSRSKKLYTYSPSKFDHPFSLRTGTITTTGTRKIYHGLDEMQYGSLGRITSVSVDLTNSVNTISSITASRFNARTNVITWIVSDQSDPIDHFIIMRTTNSIRVIVGKTHTQENSSGTFTYWHNLTEKDVGPMSYSVIPVFNQYTHGVEYSTQTIVIDPGEFNVT